LKIAKGYPEAVRRRREDNEMIKRKRTNNGITQQTKEQAKKGPYITPVLNSGDPK